VCQYAIRRELGVRRGWSGRGKVCGQSPKLGGAEEGSRSGGACGQDKLTVGITHLMFAL